MAESAAIPVVDPKVYRGISTYDSWMASTGIPLHRGYYIEDLRTLELGWWKERECNSAFIQLEGMQGVCEARVTEIPPGQTLPPLKTGVDAAVYVLSGYGNTSLWIGDQQAKKSFEWSPRSLFLVPRHHWCQFSNFRGDTAVRLLHFSYMPVAMSGSSSPNFFFNNPYEDPEGVRDELYYEARLSRMTGNHDDPYLWTGNFFPDLQAWDRLQQYQNRGAGGHHLQIKFPNTEMSAHMSVFEAGVYKKAHRHGPGRGIVIPAGEGYSVMWPEGGEKVVIPWHEGSYFVPPNRWFHQHFNVGSTPARYLALHPLSAFAGHSERVEDLARDQIEYVDEDPFVRQTFEAELKKRGASSLMPEECYTQRDYKWSFKGAYRVPSQ